MSEFPKAAFVTSPSGADARGRATSHLTFFSFTKIITVLYIIFVHLILNLKHIAYNQIYGLHCIHYAVSSWLLFLEDVCTRHILSFLIPETELCPLQLHSFWMHRVHWHGV